LQARDDFLTDICERLLLAQDVMKASHDSKPRAVEFSVGDWVLLRLHHRTAVDITTSTSKLAPGYYGPFQIVARIGNVAYCLQLPENAKIHDVFHVGLLKKFTGVPPTVAPVPLLPIVHGRVVPTPKKVLRAWLNRGTWELLVQWEGQADSDSTWERLPVFVDTYPEFHLADELFLGEGGNVAEEDGVLFIGDILN